MMLMGARTREKTGRMWPRGFAEGASPGANASVTACLFLFRARGGGLAGCCCVMVAHGDVGLLGGAEMRPVKPSRRASCPERGHHWRHLWLQAQRAGLVWMRVGGSSCRTRARSRASSMWELRDVMPFADVLPNGRCVDCHRWRQRRARTESWWCSEATVSWRRWRSTNVFLGVEFEAWLESDVGVNDGRGRWSIRCLCWP
jgi:hypothetical protein